MLSLNDRSAQLSIAHYFHRVRTKTNDEIEHASLVYLRNGLTPE